MRRTARALTPLLALLAAACTLPPPPGTLTPPRVEMLAGDARAVRYGRTAAEVLRAPAVAASARALFGANWAAAGAGGRGVARPRRAAAVAVIAGGPARLRESG